MKVSRSDLGDLYVFMNIVRHGGFRNASIELNVSASAVSHALKGLEERLRVQLVNRAFAGVVLTPAGEDLIERCRSGFGMLETGVDRLSRFRSGSEDRLRISVRGETASMVLAPYFGRYAASFPNVRLDVVVNDEPLDFIGQGYDAEIGLSAEAADELMAMKVGPPLRWALMASPSYLRNCDEPIGPDDLRYHRCIGVRAGNGDVIPWEVGSGSERHPVGLSYAATVSAFALAIEMAKAGGGIAYCPKNLVEDFLVRRDLVEILPSWSSDDGHLVLTVSRHADQTNALKSLIDNLTS